MSTFLEGIENTAHILQDFLKRLSTHSFIYRIYTWTKIRFSEGELWMCASKTQLINIQGVDITHMKFVTFTLCRAPHIGCRLSFLWSVGYITLSRHADFSARGVNAPGRLYYVDCLYSGAVREQFPGGGSVYEHVFVLLSIY